VRTIAGSNTGFNYPEALFVDQVNSELYVADFFGKAVRVFPLAANGNVTPTRTLVDGPSSGLGQVRDMIVVNNELLVLSGNDSIRVFPRTASGDVAPTRVIGGGNTKLNNPIAIAYNAGTDELFTNSYDVAGSSLPGILVFNRTDAGNVAPKRLIAGSNTQFGTFTNYLTIDSVNGEIFAVGYSGHGVVVFNLTDSGNVAPKRNLTGPGTALTSVGGLVVDNTTNRLLVNSGFFGTPAIYAFARTATGNTAPLMAIFGPSTGLASPFGMALDATAGPTGTSSALPGTIPALGLPALIALSALLAWIALRKMG
jgi:hypothetical protein